MSLQEKLLLVYFSKLKDLIINRFNYNKN